jgi:hypothetical protein
MPDEIAVATQEAVPTPTEAQEAAATEAPAEAAPPTETPPAEEPTSEPQTFDPYEALDREEMRPVLEQRDKRTRREIETQLQGEYEEKTRSWESQQTANTLAGYYGNLLQRIADMDGEGFEKAVASMQAFAEPLMKDFRESIRKTEASLAATGLYAHMATSLKTRDRDAFEKYVEDNRVGWPDAFKEYVRLATSEQLSDKDAEIGRLRDTIERMKAEGRTDKGPNLATSTPGGGKRYSQMTREERAALSPAERDAAVARELQGE